MREFKVGIDSYSLKPLDFDPFELLDWAIIHEARGVQFSEIPSQADDRGFLSELRQYAEQNDLYLEWGGGEHIPFDLQSGTPKENSAVNRKAAEQAAVLGTRTVRSCSGGLMRWREDSLPTDVLLQKTAESLRIQKPMLTDIGVVLALETHFEFTTFELLRLFEMCGAEPGGCFGVCLDTMNLLTMLEEPVAGTLRILPWIVTTHIKDGAIQLAADGLVSFTAEAGRGLIDFRSIFEVLSSLPREIALSIEDHGGDFRIPVFDPAFLAKFPDLTVGEFASLLKIVEKTRERINRKALAVLDRTRWPEECEARVKRDLRAVKAIVEQA